jgi:aconitase B
LQTNDRAIDTVDVFIEGIENSKRKVQLLKARQAYNLFVKMIRLYGIQQLIELIKTKNISSIDTLQNALPARVSREEWLNVGGQLLPVSSVNKLKQLIKTGKLSSWDAVHDYYTIEGNNYAEQKLKHALASFID